MFLCFFHVVVVLTKFLEHPYHHFWTLFMINCLPPFDLALFLEISPILSFGACLFLFPVWLSVCVCFYVLCSYAMTPSLRRVALCSRCPVRASGIMSLITRAGCFRYVPCVGYLGPPAVIESWLLMACLCVGSTLKLTVGWLWGSTLTTVYELLCRCWPHKVEFTLAGSGACQDLLLYMPLVKPTGSCSNVVWSWPLGVLILELLGRYSDAVHCQMLPGICSG